MKKLLPIILLSSSISPLGCMDRRTPSVYPLVPVFQSRSPHAHSQDEQARLLTHDFFQKDRLTLVHATPPSYQELYISEKDSETELKKLQTLLEQTEKELTSLPSKLSGKLKWRAQQRALENIKSNATVGGLTFGYYFVNMLLQIGGDPRMAINGGWNESAIPFTTSIFGWVLSVGFSLSRCVARNPDNYEN